MTHFRVTSSKLYVGRYDFRARKRELVESRAEAVEFHPDQRRAVEREVGERVEAVGLKEKRDAQT